MSRLCAQRLAGPGPGLCQSWPAASPSNKVRRLNDRPLRWVTRNLPITTLPSKLDQGLIRKPDAVQLIADDLAAAGVSAAALRCR